MKKLIISFFVFHFSFCLRAVGLLLLAGINFLHLQNENLLNMPKLIEEQI